MDATGEGATPSTRPKSFWVSLAVLAAVIFVYVLLMTNRGGTPQGTTGPAIGRGLAYLQLEPLTSTDRVVTLRDLQGRISLINFWGTWCPPCIRELPQIVELAERFSDREDFRLYAVSCGEGSDEQVDPLREQTAAFLEARGTNLPTYADQNAATRQAMAIKLGVSIAYPTTLILDREGTIRGFWQGYQGRAADEMGDVIEKLLDENSQADVAR